MTSGIYQRTEEMKRNMSEAHKGYKQTKEHKKNISLSLLGLKRKPFTEEHRKKLSEKRQEISWGNHTEKTKELMSRKQKEIWIDKKLPKKESRKRINARNMVSIKVPLKTNCEICKSTKKLVRHHLRYDKPLLVNTLCQECHHIQHIKNFYQSKFSKVEKK